MLAFFLGFAIGFAFIVYHISKANKTRSKSFALESLKNGLLTLALTRVKKDDFDEFNFSYSNYDGTKLPSLSGYNFSNACLSYILDIDQFRKSGLYSKPMEYKTIAIQKYLDKNLDTEEKILEFFDKFLETVEEETENASDIEIVESVSKKNE